VIGTDDLHALEMMRTLYAPFQRNHERIIGMDIRSAELTSMPPTPCWRRAFHL